jgi:hypothetical protein
MDIKKISTLNNSNATQTGLKTGKLEQSSGPSFQQTLDQVQTLGSKNSVSSILDRLIYIKHLFQGSFQ